jgi:hypothetical protein
MSYAVIALIASLLLLVPVAGMAAPPSSPNTPAKTPCKKPVTAGEEVVVGLYPLHVIVTKIDDDSATIDFVTELGTFLHVTRASSDELEELHVGDTVELCIVEELEGEAEV